MASNSYSILELERKVLRGGLINLDETSSLMGAEGPDIMQLFAAANRVRAHFCGDGVHLCGIVNAKSGQCSEDCAFCSQSGAHNTGVESYDLMDVDSIYNAAMKAADNGARSFGIVTAWKGIGPGKRLDIICEALGRIRDDGRIQPDLSLGILKDAGTAIALAAAGAKVYNHNLETSRSFYPQVCTTHTWEEKRRTNEMARAAGMKLCCGGIFGLGESLRQRAELALELRELRPESVPINFYHPVEGNRIQPEKSSLLMPLEALKIAAVFRMVFPRSIIKIAGGRENTLGEFQSMMFLTGANSAMVGHYLTTQGRSPEDDFKLIEACGLYVSDKGCADIAADSAANSVANSVANSGTEFRS